MKKLSTLTMDELKSLYGKNDEFAATLDEIIFDQKMKMQEEEAGFIFGKDYKSFSLENHYSTFFFSLKDEFALVWDIQDKDYLCADALETYKELLQATEEWENLTTDEQDENEELAEKIRTLAERLLKEIEDQLHEFEKLTNEDVEYELQMILDGFLTLSDWALDEDGVVYEHITKTYR